MQAGVNQCRCQWSVCGDWIGGSVRGVSVGCAHQVRATLQVRCESVFCGASCVVGTAESWRCVLSRQQCSGEVASGVCAVTRLCGSIQRCLSRVSVSGQGDTAGTWRVRILTAHDAWCMVHAAESWRCMLSKQQALSWVCWETCGGWIGSSVHSCLRQLCASGASTSSSRASLYLVWQTKVVSM